MGVEFKKIKKSSVTEAIIDQTIELISSKQLKAGDKLPSERELAEAMEVSRSSIREAMRSLQSMGIVEIKSGHGTFLNCETQMLATHFKRQHLFKKYSLLELLEARKILELELVKLAILRGNEENKAYIQETYEKTLQTMDPDEFIKKDFAFHLAIADAAHNFYLTEMLNTTRDLLLEVNVDVIRQPGQNTNATKAHKRLLEAILQGDVAAAQKEMSDHIDTVVSIVDELYPGNEV